MDSLEERCGWSHKQYFIVEELGVAWDIYIVDGIHQVGGTFDATLASHLTSCSIYVSKEDGCVTALCQGQCSNLVWGNSGGYAYLRARGRRDGT